MIWSMPCQYRCSGKERQHRLPYVELVFCAITDGESERKRTVAFFAFASIRWLLLTVCQMTVVLMVMSIFAVHPRYWDSLLFWKMLRNVSLRFPYQRKHILAQKGVWMHKLLIWHSLLLQDPRDVQFANEFRGTDFNGERVRRSIRSANNDYDEIQTFQYRPHLMFGTMPWPCISFTNEKALRLQCGVWSGIVWNPILIRIEYSVDSVLWTQTMADLAIGMATQYDPDTAYLHGWKPW